ncbi:SHOCT-like domain-containing protein [Caldisalinibacter kiritimatiensis]|uniref:YvlB/LiaX N-terminal domain-containing protein n=1 Tax=Caldisalinibacter kiritimatiensis TaxID=1304284 RepID=R1ATS4_9FIRM|nr:hypothetical protein [Caldisalinibacter kiritimatiensis]EOD00042.1 hypothetical protein L21TH_1931 [Caldisalinibacter kiritimatiensis]
MTNNLKEERLEIIKMIQDGKITAEQGADLLSALEEKKSEVINTNAKWIKVRVYDPEDNTKVKVNLPIALVDVGLKFATKFSPELKDSHFEDIDLNEIIEAIKNGAEGKIVDVESEDGEKVEVFVE